jgi:hypothetical protein
MGESGKIWMAIFGDKRNTVGIIKYLMKFYPENSRSFLNNRLKIIGACRRKLGNPGIVNSVS